MNRFVIVLAAAVAAGGCGSVPDDRGGLDQPHAVDGGASGSGVTGIDRFADRNLHGDLAYLGGGSGGAAAPDAGLGGSSAAGGAPGTGGAGSDLQAPLPLTGLSWDGVEWRSVRIDVVTGHLTVLASLPDVESVAQGVMTFEPQTARLYTLAGFTDGTHRLLGIDVSSGEIVTSPVVDPRIASIEALAPETLVALCVTGAYMQPNVVDFVEVDATTGAFRTIAPLPSVTSVFQGMSTIDVRAGIFYQVGDARTEPVEGSDEIDRLIGIDVTTGDLVVDTVAAALVYELEVAHDGSLIGLTRGPETRPWRYGALDPATGAVAELSSFGVGTFGLGISGMDAPRRRHYQYTYTPESGTELLGFDLTSGRVSVVSLESSVIGFVPAAFPQTP